MVGQITFMVVDVSMLLFIFSLAFCGPIPAFATHREPTAKERRTEPTKWPSSEPSTLMVNFPEAPKLLHKTESSTLLPATESSTLLPTTESSTLLPTTGFSTRLPTTESSTLLLTTGFSTLLPTTESSTLLPTTESSSLLPTTGFSTILPTTESSTLLPTTESSSLLPTTGFSTLLPTTESSTLLPTTESSTLLPTTGFSTLLPTTESSTLLPATGFSTLLSTTESSTLLPTTESSTLILTTESSTLLLTTESSTLLPTTKSSTMLSTNKEPTTLLPKLTELSTLQPTSGSDSNGDKATTETQEAIAEEVSGKAVTAAKTILREHRSESDYRRTVIFIKKTTNIGEGVFLRGGVNGKPIPIKHRSLDIWERTSQRDDWAAGDNFLDWDDHPEANQTGTGDGGKAKGTPAQWTTNDSNAKYFHPLNTYGDHYWIVDVMMDCLKTDNGFFEFKGIMQDKTWEGGDDLAYPCHGMGSLPKTSINHLALCGKINIFFWGTGVSCEVKDFP